MPHIPKSSSIGLGSAHNLCAIGRDGDGGDPLGEALEHAAHNTMTKGVLPVQEPRHTVCPWPTNLLPVVTEWPHCQQPQPSCAACAPGPCIACCTRAGVSRDVLVLICEKSQERWCAGASGLAKQAVRGDQNLHLHSCTLPSKRPSSQVFVHSPLREWPRMGWHEFRLSPSHREYLFEDFRSVQAFRAHGLLVCEGCLDRGQCM